MAWAQRTLPYRRIGTIALITILHVGALSWAASLKIYAPSTSPRESILVEFADIMLPEPDPIAPPEPEPEPQRVAPEFDSKPPEPIEAPETPPEPPTSGPVQEPLSEPATKPAVETPNVLTQNATDMDTGMSDRSASEGGSVTDAQIASVIQQLGCQKLRHRPDETCPDRDPFDVAAATEARQAAAPEGAPNSPWAPRDHYAYIRRQVTSSVFNKFNMTPDLFADPQPPGAYNAERIRNGQEPLWSEDMRDGFRKEE